MNKEEIDKIIAYYNSDHNKSKLQRFENAVKDFFLLHPTLKGIIHSVKSRIKDPKHLEDKITRKGISINEDNLYSEINDLVGVRILHLYNDDFEIIHNEILKYIREGEWIFIEDPVAYTWDPESQSYYESLGIKTKIKDTYYTSIHYTVKPNNSSKNPICCEIQVRTLFEEIWGEIDHQINYPKQTNNLSCKEQLRVLSKLVSTGSRLADSIYRTHKESKKVQE